MYSIYIVYRKIGIKINNKIREKKKRKKIMALIEMYSVQGSLANHQFIMNHYIMNGNAEYLR